MVAEFVFVGVLVCVFVGVLVRVGVFVGVLVRVGVFVAVGVLVETSGVIVGLGVHSLAGPVMGKLVFAVPPATWAVLIAG